MLRLITVLSLMLAPSGCHVLFGHSFSGSGGDGSIALEAGPPDARTDRVTVDVRRDGTAPRRILGLSMGYSHACAVLSTGGLRCWGWNDWGMLGIGAGKTAPARTPVPVDSSLPPATSVAAGLVHTCALAKGQVYCWGYGGWHQLGEGAAYTQTTPHAVPGATAVKQVVVGHKHTCVLHSSGGVSCLGANDVGQLGNSSTVESKVLTPVQGLSGCSVTRLAAGLYHTCALCSEGSVRCWGHATLGQIGNGSHLDARTAMDVELAPGQILKDATALWAGAGGSCAARASGRVVCWGDNSLHQLSGTGPRDRAQEIVWASTNQNRSFSEMALGAGHSCGVQNGKVWCWGDNTFGTLASQPPVGSDTPREVTQLSGVEKLSGIGASTCALLANDEVWCWGHNGRGQLGNGFDGVELRPQPVKPTLKASEIDANEHHTCAVSLTKEVLCWGNGSAGELGRKDLPIAQSAPLPIDTSLGAAQKVTVGNTHSCALVGTTAYCWGLNSSGQLGDGTTSSRWEAKPVVDANGVFHKVLDLDAGARHTCLRLDDKMVACTGSNGLGQLAKPSASSNALNPWVTIAAEAIASGDETSCALVGAELRCWGSNLGGVLGTGFTFDKLNFRATQEVVLLGADAVSPFAIGREHACAQRKGLAGPEVVCWGSNSRGQLGDGTFASKAAPDTKGTGLGAVLDLDASSGLAWTGAHSCAVLTTGELRCWGWNAWGQLGTGSRDEERKPAPVNSSSSGVTLAFRKVATGTHHTCGIVDSGLEKDTVYCWGYNGNGQLGIGVLPVEHDPQQVKGLDGL